jgi:hypothetical protein
METITVFLIITIIPISASTVVAILIRRSIGRQIKRKQIGRE